MRYQQIENLDVPLSSLVMGSTYIGSSIDNKLSSALLETYVDKGGTAIDTARVYGNGLSEEFIGSWVEQHKLRDKILLVTKGAQPTESGESRFTPKELAYDIAKSQDALRSDSFDIWFFHRDDESLPASEIMEMIRPYLEKKIITVLGASNWKPHRLLEANKYAKEVGLPPISFSQIQYSLARSTAETWDDFGLFCMDEASLQWYKESRFPLFAYSSQAKGFYSKMLNKGKESLSPKALKRFYLPENIEKIERVKYLSDKLGVLPSAIAVSYVTSGEPSAVAIIGSSSVEQLDETLSASDVLLTESEKHYLERGVWDVE